MRKLLELQLQNTPLHGRNTALTSSRTPLSQAIVRSLADHILRGEFAVGERLPTEQQLIAEFGVSRTVVREAIAELRSRGLVKTIQGRGAFVTPHDTQEAFRIEPGLLPLRQEVIALVDLRLAIESEAAVLAAQNRTEAHLEAMSKIIEDMSHSIAAGEGAEHPDLKFHRVIAEASGNPYFVSLLDYIGLKSIPRIRIPSFQLAGQTREAYLHRMQMEHEQIRYAISRKDSDAARAALRLHLSSSRQRLLSLKDRGDANQ